MELSRATSQGFLAEFILSKTEGLEMILNIEGSLRVGFEPAGGLPREPQICLKTAFMLSLLDIDLLPMLSFQLAVTQEQA